MPAVQAEARISQHLLGDLLHLLCSIPLGQQLRVAGWSWQRTGGWSHERLAGAVAGLQTRSGLSIARNPNWSKLGLRSGFCQPAEPGCREAALAGQGEDVAANAPPLSD